MHSPLRVLTLALGLLWAASGFAQTAPAPKANAPAATTTMPAKPAMAGTKTAAPGGGAGKVWVNSGSKRYHCEGTKFYGKTKEGAYMGEAEAKAQGYQGLRGKSCAM